MLSFLYLIGIAVAVYFGRDYIVNDPKTTIILFIVALFGFVIVSEVGRIPRRIRAKKAMAHLTGIATGRIKSHYEDTYESWDSERETYETRSRGTVVSYEFEVDGKTYTGSGYGSWAIKNRQYQPICYDPQNPSDNCTQAHYNSQTKSHLFSSLLYMAICLLILYGVFRLLFWIMGN
ncbi:MAG: hypothetical protein J5379_04165 [Clostridiales bacterium]|nr:hypothetical protein [Clostridiales bacterium]